MAKKNIISDNELDQTAEEIFEEKVEEIEEETQEVVEEKLPEPSLQTKKKLIVALVLKDDLIVKDARGNGIRIPKTEEHKNIKIGDIIYL